MVIEFNGTIISTYYVFLHMYFMLANSVYIIKVLFMKILILNMEKEQIQLEDVVLL